MHIEDWVSVDFQNTFSITKFTWKSEESDITPDTEGKLVVIKQDGREIWHPVEKRSYDILRDTSDNIQNAFEEMVTSIYIGTRKTKQGNAEISDDKMEKLQDMMEKMEEMEDINELDKYTDSQDREEYEWLKEDYDDTWTTDKGETTIINESVLKEDYDDTWTDSTIDDYVFDEYETNKIDTKKRF